MKVQLVVADLDGSLVETGKPLSDQNKKAIEYLHSKGIKVGIASGRNLFDITRLPKRWNLDFDFDMYIGLNGSEVLDTATGVRVESYKLSREAVKDIIIKMRPLGITPFILYKDGMLMTKEDAGALASAKRNDFHIYIAQDESELWQMEHAKIMYRTTVDQGDRLWEYARKLTNDKYKAVRTQSMVTEFVHPLVDKSKGLINYCNIYGIPMNEVVAFGDTTNDNEMMECCHGICLLNGSDDTKALAKEITRKTCQDDGFADWIFNNVD